MGTGAGAPPLEFRVAFVPVAGEAAGPPSNPRHLYLEGRRPVSPEASRGGA